MEGKKKLKRMRWMMILTGIPVTALQWFSIIFWIAKGIWWPFIVWAAVWTAVIVFIAGKLYRKILFFRNL